jgi:hypothetical protein
MTRIRSVNIVELSSFPHFSILFSFGEIDIFLGFYLCCNHIDEENVLM